MGIEARDRRAERALKAIGKSTEPGLKIQVTFLDHVLDPVPQDVEVEIEPNPDFGINVICIPTGMHLHPDKGTRWHPTGETYLAEVEGESLMLPIGRQVPDLIATEQAADAVETGSSKIDERSLLFVKKQVEEEVTPGGRGLVTPEELEAAKAEAAALREKPEPVDRTTAAERRIWGGIATRKDRYDFSALYPRWPGGNAPK